jgi:glycosyltransferase involved in cell wall biosynthesis
MQTKIEKIDSSSALAIKIIDPSIEETFSLVTAEAICCGIPVIVSNKTALPELILNNNGKVVLFNDAKSYANIINMFNII